MNAKQIAEKINNQELDIISVTKEAIARAKADTNNAVIRIHEETAIKLAENVKEKIANGENLPMAGVPIILKDNICYKDHLTTACSKILDGFKPPYNATVVEKLLADGAIIIGTANMDEFAMGSSNETSFYGPVKNPHDPERIPGGSSGGSATSVASNITPIALGSDTGGSIRQPASLCGCVGMKPSYGRVSRYGLMAFGSSLDQIGPFAKNIDDTALCLNTLSGYDKNDSTSADREKEINLEGIIKTDASFLKGLKVGYIKEHEELLEKEMAEIIANAKKLLEENGAELVPVSLPHEKYATAIYYVIGTGEASSNLSRYDGIHYGHRSEDITDLPSVYKKTRAEGFGLEVKRRVMLGTYVLSAGYFDAYYRQAMKVRRIICEDYDALFKKCDILMGLASPTTAFKTGEKSDDPLQMYLSDIFTIAANLSGVPALSMPFTKQNNLPVGLHLQSPMWSETKLLQCAKAIETLI